MKFFNLEVNRIPQPVLTTFETDKQFNELYNLAEMRTNMVWSRDHPRERSLRMQRHYTLQNLLRNIPKMSGDVAECGVWRGLSAYQIASILSLAGFSGEFHIFDSFQGLSNFHPKDGRPQRKEDKQYSYPLKNVKENLSEFNFIRYHPGWIPSRFIDVADKKFSFVHIDADLYQPVLESVKFFYPRMQPGGIMVFDDYGLLSFPGTRAAVDEITTGKEDFFLQMPAGNAFLVKGMLGCEL